MAHNLAFTRLAFLERVAVTNTLAHTAGRCSQCGRLKHAQRASAFVAKISRPRLYGASCGTERRESSSPQHAALSSTPPLASTCRLSRQRSQYCRSMRQVTVTMTQPSEGNESASNMMMR